MRILRDNNGPNLSEGLHAAEKDLIWNLCIALMLLWSLASSTAFIKPVTEERSNTSQKHSQKPDLVLFISAAGNILLGAEKAEKSRKALEAALQELSAGKKDASVLVAAEPGAPAGVVFNVLSTCERHGLHPCFQLYQP